jgi:hypothetical protein
MRFSAGSIVLTQGSSDCVLLTVWRTEDFKILKLTERFSRFGAIY